jgi:hypothetical protein
VWKAAIPVAVMIAIAVTAFVIPATRFPDCGDCAPAEYRARLRAGAELMSTVPALRNQVVEAVVEGPNPEDVSGRVVARSLFGIKVGTIDIDGRSSSQERRTGMELGLWGAFGVLELALGGLAAWLATRATS